MDGKLFYKALIKDTEHGWILSPEYFISKKDAQKEYFSHEIEWPVDCIAEGVVYVPSEAEQNEHQD